MKRCESNVGRESAKIARLTCYVTSGKGYECVLLGWDEICKSDYTILRNSLLN